MLIQTDCGGLCAVIVFTLVWETWQTCAGACEWEKKRDRKHWNTKSFRPLCWLTIKVILGNTKRTIGCASWLAAFSVPGLSELEVNSPRPVGVRRVGLRHSWMFSQANLGGPVCSCKNKKKSALFVALQQKHWHCFIRGGEGRSLCIWPIYKSFTGFIISLSY